MKRLRALLVDRRRSQRGSVLSGVLIMTAFVAILSGALMTELSANFLLSRDLMNQVTDEATVSSAIELSLSSLRSTDIDSGCPDLSPVTLNKLTAVPNYLSCWPAVDRRSPQFQQIASAPAPFRVDGVHAQVGGLDDYIVADAAGDVYDYSFGSRFSRWKLSLGGPVTSPPLVVVDPSDPSLYLDVLPLAGSGCAPAANCLSVRSDDGSSTPPSPVCTTPLNGPVFVQPTNGFVLSGTIFYGQGSLLGAQDDLGCTVRATATTPGSQPVAAGPLAFPCTFPCKKASAVVYTALSDSGSSQLARYVYSSGLSLVQTLALPWGGVTGIVASSTTLPASLAISFAAGGIALVQLSSGGTMTLAATANIGAAIGDAPYWCAQCGDVIGVGGADGRLHLFDSSLNGYATSASVGSAIITSPAADDPGDWYFGSNDGNIHELQARPGQATLVNAYGPMGQFGSSVQVGPCPSGICVYAGTLSSAAFVVRMDARDTVISACISTAPPACSGTNPRLWAQAEIGVRGDPTAVHVQGWSYYSP